MAAKLQEAVGTGALALDEYVQRLDVVYAATSREHLANAIAGLPAAPPVGRGRRITRIFGLFGDEQRSGAWRPDRAVTVINVFGDTTLDLRGAHIVGDEVVVRCWSAFGDVELIVPEGVEVDLSGFCPCGDRVIDVVPVPRISGTPQVRLVAFALFGDATVRSAPHAAKSDLH